MTRIEVTLDGCDGLALVDLILLPLSMALMEGKAEDQGYAGESDQAVAAQGAFQESEGG